MAKLVTSSDTILDVSHDPEDAGKEYEVDEAGVERVARNPYYMDEAELERQWRSYCYLYYWQR